MIRVNAWGANAMPGPLLAAILAVVLPVVVALQVRQHPEVRSRRWFFLGPILFYPLLVTGMWFRERPGIAFPVLFFPGVAIFMIWYGLILGPPRDAGPRRR